MASLAGPRLWYLAPLVMLAHLIEESFGFLEWINGQVDPDLTGSGFLAINAGGLLITLVLSVANVRSVSRPLALTLVAWLGFLVLANGLLHLAGTVLLGEYVPGTVTGVVLYQPYFVAATATACRFRDIRPGQAVVAALLGALPMVAQGIGVFAAGRSLLW